jgi:transcriptional regulator with XRE-family HTH domain
MSLFSAQEFASWLKDGFDKSPIKTYTELASAVGSNKATISRLINGSAQTLTERPSQPRPELVIKLARTLGLPVNQGLTLAGHSPIDEGASSKPKNLGEFLAALEALGIEQFQFATKPGALDDYTEDDFEELLERIKADVDITLRRKKK